MEGGARTGGRCREEQRGQSSYDVGWDDNPTADLCQMVHGQVSERATGP